MNRTARTILTATGLIAAAVLIAGGGTVWWKYRQTVSANPPIEAAGALTVKPDVVARLGTPLTVTMNYRCPWHRRPVEAILTPGDGLKVVGQPTIRRQSWGFGYAIWRVQAMVRPFRTGQLTGSTLETVFDRPAGAEAVDTRKISLPALRITELTPDDPAKLELAPPCGIAQKITRRHWLIGSAVLLAAILGLLLWLRYRRHREEAARPLPPWQAALLELAGLRMSFGNHSIQPETCFARLTDIVRDYLEKRFRLRAPKQTTEEFMTDLNRHHSPLQEEHRRFLGDFLHAADLVKFAGIPADGLLLEQAIGRAETLVNETKPQEDTP